jgi:hypothetical protein
MLRQNVSCIAGVPVKITRKVALDVEEKLALALSMEPPDEGHDLMEKHHPAVLRDVWDPDGVILGDQHHHCLESLTNVLVSSTALSQLAMPVRQQHCDLSILAYLFYFLARTYLTLWQPFQ